MDLAPEEKHRLRVKLRTTVAAWHALVLPSSRLGLPHLMAEWQSLGVDVSPYQTEREQTLLTLVCVSTARSFWLPAADLLPGIVRRWDEQLALIPTNLLAACFWGVLKARPPGDNSPIQPDEVFLAYFDNEEYLVTVSLALSLEQP